MSLNLPLIAAECFPPDDKNLMGKGNESIKQGREMLLSDAFPD